MNINFSSKRFKIFGSLFTIILIAYYFCLPQPLFKTSYSTILQSKGGELLSATIAKDGQWRFPLNQEVPQKFIDAIITFEDKRFWSHPGVDVISFIRALKQNLEAGRIVSGGSTISMQVIRLSRKGKSRNVFEKIVELIQASRLELRYSKQEILALYASHAPFGGNVVGLDAACWRYFGRTANELSWAEAAMLAVLPNAPSLIHPGKNREQLIQKRNALLDKLLAAGKIDKSGCDLAKEEPIPDKPIALPKHARHLLTELIQLGGPEQKHLTTIDFNIQQRVEEIVEAHHIRLSGNQIHNAAAIVAEVNTGSVVAYVGNVINNNREHGDDVNVIKSPRSTGSILKPFLFAAMLDEGKILPKTLLPDVPTYINGFSPKNFSKDFDGAVPADKALIRSLNIPAVLMLREYRYEKFYELLRNMGISTIKDPADHYGLSLILGGAEGTLWDITSIYASMGRTLNNFFERPGKRKYSRGDFHSLNYRATKTNDTLTYNNNIEEASWLSAASIYQTFDALKEVYRPGEESGWRHFYSSKKIAWKTGTSFGFRDGWAVGITPKYVVGIWVGNADGEGRPGLTGTDAAAPILFDIFSQLESPDWFVPPQLEMEKISICLKSGYRNTDLCTEVDTIITNRIGLQSPACPFHKVIHLAQDKKSRVHSACEDLANTIQENWFVLPASQEYYYKPKNISYKSLPPYRADCQPTSSFTSMELVYPKHNSRIYIPRDLTGKVGNAVFQLAHRNSSSTVYWHLDGNFLGATQRVHNLAINASEGVHQITVIDDQGEMLEQKFEVLSKM